MKLIIAYIQPERLPAVKQELFAADVFKLSVTTRWGVASRGATTRRTAVWNAR